MNSSELSIMLDALKHKREIQTREIDKLISDLEKQYSEALKTEGKKNLTLTDRSLFPEVNTIKLASSFPVMSHIHIQIFHVFDEQKRPLKMVELNEIINKATGKEYDIRETVRTLQKKKKLVLMKINKSNKNSYWVRPDWVDKANNTLKGEYKLPDMDVLYTKDQIEFL